jgi:hypothetical protein
VQITFKERDHSKRITNRPVETRQTKLGARIAPLNALQVKRMLYGRFAQMNYFTNRNGISPILRKT